MQLIEACLKAARAAWPMVGAQDKMAVDGAAVAAMRTAFNSFDFGGRVVIGEGAKDQAPMLFNGEVLGSGGSLDWDIAVDPIDGTRLAAEGMPGAVSVVAASPLGTMMECPDVFFMKKLVCGPEGVGIVDIDFSATENITRLAAALDKPITDVTVAVIYKAVNYELIEEVQASGANWHRFDEGDVAMAVAAATPGSGIDMMLGVGGNPEGVLAACAVRILGGFMQGVLAPRSADEIESALNAGYAIDQKFGLSELVGGDRQIFVLAGVTPGILVDGISESEDGKLDVELFVLDTELEGGRRIKIRSE
jgi:fructose-1,6-bisphosphatase II